jgi:hypothetical protein
MIDATSHTMRQDLIIRIGSNLEASSIENSIIVFFTRAIFAVGVGQRLSNPQRKLFTNCSQL